MELKTEREYLRDGLHAAVAMLAVSIEGAERNAKEIDRIMANRKRGDGYASQEQLERVRDNWLQKAVDWIGQSGALQNLIEREGLEF